MHLICVSILKNVLEIIKHVTLARNNEIREQNDQNLLLDQHLFKYFLLKVKRDYFLKNKKIITAINRLYRKNVTSISKFSLFSRRE